MKKLNKKILQYSAIFEPAKEGGYNVSFLSFPGCVTFGRTFEEAKEKAQEVLELWLEELTSEGKKIYISRNRPIVDEVEARIPAKAKFSYAPGHC